MFEKLRKQVKKLRKCPNCGRLTWLNWRHDMPRGVVKRLEAAQCFWCKAHLVQERSEGIGTPKCIYIKALENKRFKCSQCGSDIEQVPVRHSVHFEGTDGGLGEVRTLHYPYCPQCEEEPSTQGAGPVYEPFPRWTSGVHLVENLK